MSCHKRTYLYLEICRIVNMNGLMSLEREEVCFANKEDLLWIKGPFQKSSPFGRVKYDGNVNSTMTKNNFYIRNVCLNFFL